MHAKVFGGRVLVEQFEYGHAVLKHGGFSDSIGFDLSADGYYVLVRSSTVVANDGFGELTNRRFVEDCAKSTVGDGERNTVQKNDNIG
jgi:hypothetical protein